MNYSSVHNRPSSQFLRIARQELHSRLMAYILKMTYPSTQYVLFYSKLGIVEYLVVFDYFNKLSLHLLHCKLFIVRIRLNNNLYYGKHDNMKIFIVITHIIISIISKILPK